MGAQFKPSNALLYLGSYGVAIVVMISLVTAMFYRQGFLVCFQIVLYVSCLAVIKIALKMVYQYHFKYPKFITACHLFVSSSAAFVVLICRKVSTGKEIPVPTQREFFMGILPIASTFGFSIMSENSALIFNSAAFSEVVASSNPLMSAFLTWAMGMPFPVQLLMPIGVVVLGCGISVSGGTSFSNIGLALSLMAIFFRGLKAVMQQKLMTGETKEKFDPVTLMAWTCMCAFFVVMVYSLCTEEMAPISSIGNQTDLFGFLIALLGSCAIACTLNISALFVIKQLGAVGMQMVSQMKAVLVVLGGIALLGETFTTSQWLGFTIVLGGVYWYSYLLRVLNPSPDAKSN
jgi:drug/metabolite transporter (DMT)-like permease